MFAEGLEVSTSSRERKGKTPRRNRYIHYCGWSYALLVSLIQSLLQTKVSTVVYPETVVQCIFYQQILKMANVLFLYIYKRETIYSKKIDILIY